MSFKRSRALRLCIWIMLGVLSLLCHVEASTYPLPPPGQFLVGQLQDTKVQEGETLLDIARRYNVALVELQDANPESSLCQCFPSFCLPGGGS